MVDIVVARFDVFDEPAVPDDFSLAAGEGGAFSACPIESQNVFVDLGYWARKGSGGWFWIGADWRSVDWYGFADWRRPVETTFVKCKERAQDDQKKDYFRH